MVHYCLGHPSFYYYFQVNTADILFKVMIMLKVLCIIDADSIESRSTANNSTNETFIFSFDRGFSPETRDQYYKTDFAVTQFMARF